MTFVPHAQPLVWKICAWSSVVLAGVAAPLLAVLLLASSPMITPLVLMTAPILAIGLMAVGMIGAAAAGSLRIGVMLAIATGVGLVLFAQALGMPSTAHPISAGLAVVIASVSFAARGALFARSASDRGWLIAMFVVGGEAAMLITASTMPDALPDWLLVVLPAQWASAAIQATIAGNGAQAASSELLALAGTAAATLLVARLWPRRWPYAIMFCAWLALSALVWHRPAAVMSNADPGIAVATVFQTHRSCGLLASFHSPCCRNRDTGGSWKLPMTRQPPH